MSTEGILLNHGGLSSGSSRPVGGISTFSEKQYDQIFTDDELGNTFQVHNNINGHTYFTKWEDGFFGFYKLNATATGLEKINNIWNISSYYKNMYHLTLFIFNSNLYCNIGSATESYDIKRLFRYVKGEDNWVSEPNLGIKGLWSAAELNGVLYISKNLHSNANFEIYKTTDLKNFESLNRELSDDVQVFLFQNNIFFLGGGNYITLYYLKNNNTIEYIDTNSLSSRKISTNYFYIKEKALIINANTKIYSLTFDNNFKLLSEEIWASNFNDSNRYVLDFFPISDDIIGKITNTNSFYLLTPQNNIITQYLLKGNKILVERIEETQLLSNNIIKKDNFIEVTEDGIVKIKLNTISNYNGSRTQNFLIF